MQNLIFEKVKKEKGEKKKNLTLIYRRKYTFFLKTRSMISNVYSFMIFWISDTK